MRRWMLKAGATDPSGLLMEDAALPEPGPGEVRVRVRAVSLNARDRMVMGGGFARLPDRDLVPVSDGAGEVDTVGEGVTGWAVGDRVTNLFFPTWTGAIPVVDNGFGPGGMDRDGMLSEFVVLPATGIAHAPESLDFAGASTLACAGATAWNAVHGDHPPGPGQKVLVLGSGGVSLFALLWARAAGAEVFATSGSDARLAQVKAFGAKDGVNYATTPDWGHAIFEMTGGVDKVVDTVGTSTLNQSLGAVGHGGEVAVVGLMAMGDAAPDVGLLLGREARVRGVAVGSVPMHLALTREVDAHAITPPIARRFAFEEAREAYAAQASPDLFGKVVIELG